MNEFDFLSLIKEARDIGDRKHEKYIRVALLSDASTQHLALLTKALFSRAGYAADIYEGAFGAFELEALNPRSGLYQSKPDAIVVVRATQPMREVSAISAARAEELWHALRAHSPVLIIESTIALPYERVFGNFERRVADALSSRVHAYNTELAQKAHAANVLLLDLEHLAAHVGRRHWFDEKMWAVGKLLCAQEFLPLVAQNIVGIIRAAKGHVAKCLVLDLDNTLWGGVVGDDGLEGIRIGHAGPEGEAFTSFQRYIKRLKERGIVLAVCSKNEEDVAKRVFREHPDMVLREEDIAVFVANWQNKADNIRYIARTLNVGLDSLVFVDDNPFERNLVRDMAPEVIVPEMPEDPAYYIRTLSELNLFETTSYSEEDKKRAAMYREETERNAAQVEYTNIDDYLRALNMKATVARFDEFHLPRIAQLIGRSNQFNLMTRRYSEAQCKEFMRSDTHHPFYVTLADTFGDNGLISVVVLAREGETLKINEWIMSCRVLSRGVEEHAMNYVVAHAKEHGLKTIIGAYIPTDKNMMVKDFYARFGFEKVEEKPDGSAVWKLDVDRYEVKKTFIV